MHDFLARRFLHVLRAGMQKMNSLFKQVPAFAKISWRFCFQDELNFLGDVSDVCNLQRQRHTSARTHGVDGNRERGFFFVDNRVLEQ